MPYTLRSYLYEISFHNENVALQSYITLLLRVKDKTRLDVQGSGLGRAL